jgi:hypothetical protein
MSRVSNHSPEVIDNFQYEDGFFPPGKSQPTPRPISAAESQLHQPTAKEFWVEYFYRNVKAGRQLTGPFSKRNYALMRATELLGETDYNYEICRVSVLTFVKGGAA